MECQINVNWLSSNQNLITSQFRRNSWILMVEFFALIKNNDEISANFIFLVDIEFWYVNLGCFKIDCLLEMSLFYLLRCSMFHLLLRQITTHNKFSTYEYLTRSSALRILNGQCISVSIFLRIRILASNGFNTFLGLRIYEYINWKWEKFRWNIQVIYALFQI